MLQSYALSPAANGLFINSNDNNIYSFTYVRGIITVTSTVQNFGTTAPQSIFNNNGSPLKIIVAGANIMQLYTYCTASACASGQCDFNGNCIGGCTVSDPPRNGTHCSCPSGYFDDTVNAQCAIAYNITSSNYFSQTSTVVGMQCAQQSQTAFLQANSSTMLVTCLGSSLLYSVSIAKDVIYSPYTFNITANSSSGVAFMNSQP